MEDWQTRQRQAGKGAAVAAAEYLICTSPGVSGFSSRNLRRMREFYRAYENEPEVLAQAMTIGWTQNIVILENCATTGERTWYIAAVRRFHWSKTELLEKITRRTHEDNVSPLYSTEAPEAELPHSNIDVSNTATRTLANRENHFALPNCVGHDAGGRSENGLYQSHEAGYYRGPESGYETLRSLGFRFVLLGEVTLAQDSIDSAALLSDIYAAQGMKIALSGMDSLGFWFAPHQELYDRAKMIRTTSTLYREHSRLLGIDQIKECIRYGDTLRTEKQAFIVNLSQNQQSRNP